MNRDSVTLDEVIAFLVDLIQLDSFALGALVNTRVSCNKTLANHPTVQVMECDDKYSVGLVGILNGLFGTLPDGRGKITFVLDEDEVINVRGTWPEETPWFEAAQE